MPLPRQRLEGVCSGGCRLHLGLLGGIHRVAPDSQQLLGLINLYLAQRNDKLTIDKVMARFDEVKR